MDLTNLLNQVALGEGDIVIATSKLNELMEQADAVPKLLAVVTSNQSEQTQQAALVFLRRKLKRGCELEPDVLEQVKNNVLAMLESYVGSPSEKLARSVIELTARMFDMCLTDTEEWTQMLQWLERNCRSENDECRVMCYGMLVSIIENSDLRLGRMIPYILKMIENGLADQTVAKVRYNSLKAAGNLLIFCQDEHLPLFVPILNETHAVIRSLLNTDVVFDTDPFSLLFESLSSAKLATSINLQPSLELCLEIVSSPSIDEFLRKSSLQYVCEVVRMRSAIIVKAGAGESIFGKIFEFMCTLNDPEREEDSVLQSCSLVVDIMAQRLPSSSFVPVLQKYVDAAVKSADTFVRRAGYLTLAVSMEGCCRFYAEHCIDDLIRLILTGVSDSEESVSLSSMFALAELLAHSEASVTEQAPLFMPVILSSLDKIVDVDYDNGDENTQLYVSRVFYALEEACENLDNELISYLADLFTKLINIYSRCKSLRMKEFVLESISFAVSAVDKLITPFVPGLLEVLNGCLKEELTDENEGTFCEALGALGSIFRYTKPSEIGPQADATAQFAMKLLLNEETEPSLKSSAYDVMGSLSCVYKENMDTNLVRSLTEEVLKTFESTEGLVHAMTDSQNGVVEIENRHCSGDNVSARTRSRSLGAMHESNGVASVDGNMGDDNSDALDDDEEDDDDDDDDVDLVETEFSDERVSALAAICDLCTNAPKKVVPYIEKLFDAAFKHLDYPDENIQTQAIRSLSMMVTVLFSQCNTHRDSSPAGWEERLSVMVTRLFTELDEKIREGDVHEVVVSAFNGLNTMIIDIEEPFFSIISLKDVAFLIDQALNRKITCLNAAADDDVDLEEPEVDGLVMEAAGEILSPIANAVPADQFKDTFSQHINILFNHLKRPNLSRKSFVVAIIACIVQQARGQVIDPNQCFELFNTFYMDESEDVSQSAVFGLGLILQKNAERFKDRCDVILNNLHALVQRKPNVEKSALRDTVCGCASRILQVLGSPPNQQLVEFIMSMLPMRGDLENYGAFFETMNMVWTNAVLEPYMENLLKLTCTVILSEDEEVNEEMKETCVNLLRARATTSEKSVTDAIGSFSAEEQNQIGERLRASQQ